MNTVYLYKGPQGWRLVKPDGYEIKYAPVQTIEWWLLQLAVEYKDLRIVFEGPADVA